jgi:hypothetical protein
LEKSELQSKLVEILTSLQSAAGKASDFAMEQLPDMAQSYVAYGRAVSLIWIVAWLIALVLCAAMLKRFHSKPWYSTWTFDRGKNVRADSNVLAMAAAGFGALLSAGSLIAALSTGALVWFAPKVWLLKEVATLIK